MGFFSGLEGSLEKYIEGFFRDRFKGRVQPLEIAKKLAREMRDRKRVSVNLVYVPNDYEVFLNPDDLAAISYLVDPLSGELQEYISQKAREKKFTLVDNPRVSFFEDESLKAGQIRVRGRFENTSGAGHTPPGTAFTGNEMENTLNFRPTRDTAPIDLPPQAICSCVVEVLEGPLSGKVFRLETCPAVVGRRDSCEIVIQDESISRRHARLDMQRGKWVVTDLDSTNGTFVNGERVVTSVLEPEDIIKFGAVTCVFRVD
ncbi:MAG: FhaA domain-containing protein [Bacillota bacterium]